MARTWTSWDPVFFDYGEHTTMGDRVFANFNITVLDCAPVTIGDDVLFGPNVSLLPPMHPLRWQDRNVRKAADGSTYDYEYGRPIVIGSNCWYGGKCHRVGRRDHRRRLRHRRRRRGDQGHPAHSVAVGNPARVIRTITDTDASALQGLRAIVVTPSGQIPGPGRPVPAGAGVAEAASLRVGDQRGPLLMSCSMTSRPPGRSSAAARSMMRPGISRPSGEPPYNANSGS